MRRSLLNSSTTSVDQEERNLEFIIQGPVDKSNFESATFKEHVNRAGCYVYELNDSMTRGVRLLATEEPDPDDDFCIGFYNRKTRKTVFKPASYLHIRSRDANNCDISQILNGQIKRRRTDFGLDKSLSMEEKSLIRQNLTSQFGNTRSKRMLEAVLRRNVNDDSKNAMDTSLDTTNTSADLSLGSIGSPEKPNIAQAESSVLPPLNKDAKDPTEIIDLKKLFKNDDEAFFLEEGVKFFAEANTIEKLAEYDIPTYVASIIVRNYKKPHCTAACMLLAILTKMLRNTNRFVLKRAFGFGQNCYARIANQYLVNATLMTNHNTRIASTDKARMQSYTFALILEMSENYVVPITPLAQELNLPENAISKLLQSMGCLVHDAMPEQMISLNTVKIARLVGGAFAPTKGKMRRKRR